MVIVISSASKNVYFLSGMTIYNAQQDLFMEGYSHESNKIYDSLDITINRCQRRRWLYKRPSLPPKFG